MARGHARAHRTDNSASTQAQPGVSNVTAKAVARRRRKIAQRAKKRLGDWLADNWPAMQDEVAEAIVRAAIDAFSAALAADRPDRAGVNNGIAIAARPAAPRAAVRGSAAATDAPGVNAMPGFREHLARWLEEDLALRPYAQVVLDAAMDAIIHRAIHLAASENDVSSDSSSESELVNDDDALGMEDIADAAATESTRPSGSSYAKRRHDARRSAQRAARRLGAWLAKLPEMRDFANAIVGAAIDAFSVALAADRPDHGSAIAAHPAAPDPAVRGPVVATNAPVLNTVPGFRERLARWLQRNAALRPYAQTMLDAAMGALSSAPPSRSRHPRVIKQAHT